MPTQHEALPFALIAVLALGAVGLGLWSVGGPLQGRAERRDEERREDLVRLSMQIDCVLFQTGSLPETLAGVEAAPVNQGLCRAAAPRFADPYSGVAYGFEKLDAKTWRICASFESPKTVTDFRFSWLEFSGTTGCLTGNLRPKH
jgi:hypothetical protein